MQRHVLIVDANHLTLDRIWLTVLFCAISTFNHDLLSINTGKNPPPPPLSLTDDDEDLIALSNFAQGCHLQHYRRRPLSSSLAHESVALFFNLDSGICCKLDCPQGALDGNDFGAQGNVNTLRKHDWILSNAGHNYL